MFWLGAGANRCQSFFQNKPTPPTQCQPFLQNATNINRQEPSIKPQPHRPKHNYTPLVSNCSYAVSNYACGFVCWLVSFLSDSYIYASWVISSSSAISDYACGFVCWLVSSLSDSYIYASWVISSSSAISNYACRFVVWFASSVSRFFTECQLSVTAVNFLSSPRDCILDGPCPHHSLLYAFPAAPPPFATITSTLFQTRQRPAVLTMLLIKQNTTVQLIIRN